MSNYKMSYRAFENTASSIYHLIGMMADAIDEGEPLEMSSSHEQRAFDMMQDLIQDFQKMLEQYNETFPPIGQD